MLLRGSVRQHPKAKNPTHPGSPNTSVHLQEEQDPLGVRWHHGNQGDWISSGSPTLHIHFTTALLCRAHSWRAELFSPAFNKNVPHSKSPKEQLYSPVLCNCSTASHFTRIRSQPIHFPLNYYASLCPGKKKYMVSHKN